MVLSGICHYLFFCIALRESKKRYDTSFNYINVWFQMDALWKKSRSGPNRRLNTSLIMFQALFIIFIFSTVVLTQL